MKPQDEWGPADWFVHDMEFAFVIGGVAVFLGLIVLLLLWLCS